MVDCRLSNRSHSIFALTMVVVTQRSNIHPKSGSHTEHTSQSQDHPMLSAHVHSIVADGMNVFYREAGIPGRPVILLLHGGIASSFQFRQLMPLLAREFVSVPEIFTFIILAHAQLVARYRSRPSRTWVHQA